eukprot:9316835-Prorocentrum_lima.AAC.1
MRRGGTLRLSTMSTNERGGVSMGETTVPIQSNEKVNLGRAKAPEEMKEFLVLKSIRRFRRSMGRNDPDDALGQLQ